MIAPTPPPMRMLPNIEPLVADSTDASPASKPSLLQVTCMSSFERLTITDPGEVRNHLPLALLSSQVAPGSSLPPADSTVCKETLWLVVPVMEAQPLASD